MGAQAAKEAKATTKEVVNFILDYWVARVCHWLNFSGADKAWVGDVQNVRLNWG